MHQVETKSSSGTTASRIEPGAGLRGKLLFDLSGIDLSRVVLDRAGVERWNPHRGHMAQVDAVVWENAERSMGVGLKRVRGDEFWVAGHFPGKPMMPGVLMVEAAAQMGNYLWNARSPEPQIAAFMKIEDSTFRAPVLPGDDLYILVKEVKSTVKRFTMNGQGVVGDKLVFETRITGMAIEALRGG